MADINFDIMKYGKIESYGSNYLNKKTKRRYYIIEFESGETIRMLMLSVLFLKIGA